MIALSILCTPSFVASSHSFFYFLGVNTLYAIPNSNTTNAAGGNTNSKNRNIQNIFVPF